MFSPVNIPQGGTSEVYTSGEQREEFGYANVRKATYRGSMNDNDRYSICSDHQHDISLQVLYNLGSMAGSVC